jgi:hypothetical protein
VYQKNVLATTLSWLIYDIGYYGSITFTPAMLAIVFGHEKDDDSHNVDISAVAEEVCVEHSYIYRNIHARTQKHGHLLISTSPVW